MFCFIDMDGVVDDFVAGVCRLHGRSNPYVDNPASLGVFEMEKLWGITAKEFWAPVERAGREFWANLNQIPEADDIVQIALSHFGARNVAFLSSPALDPGCVPGKRDWIARHYPELAKNLILTSAKRFLAGPDRVLIDDRTENVDEFQAAGGRGVLLPRPWNRDHQNSHRALEILRQRMDGLWEVNFERN